MDGRNGCLFVKVGRQDPLWIDAGRHRKPSQNSTLAILNIKEEYHSFKKAMKHIYHQIKKLTTLTIPPHPHPFPIRFYEVYDMKMRLLVLGMDRLYLHTTLCGCYLCWARRDGREWSDHTQHHAQFPGSDSEYEEWKQIDDGGDPFKIKKKEGISLRTIEELWSIGKEIADLESQVKFGVKGAKKKLKERIKETGVIQMPISRTPLYYHFGELIHIIENISARSVKLCLTELPEREEIAKLVLQAFRRATNLKFEEDKEEKKKKIPLWNRIKKEKLGRTDWIHVLQHFFIENEGNN